jgi:hypothetical protein
MTRDARQVPMPGVGRFLSEIEVSQLDHYELFWLARQLRKRLGQLIDQADMRGDGPLVDGLCQEARQYFTPGLRW